VEALCDQVAILRKGYLVGEAAAPYDIAQLVEMMFGKQIVLKVLNPSGSRKCCL
jgi:ABC-type uncharacterized transport system ATPase subunit